MEKSIIVIGDALQKLQRVASGYCDCCVTSPPYYGLRDYGIPEQIGLQEQPEEYIKNLFLFFAKCAACFGTTALYGLIWATATQEAAKEETRTANLARAIRFQGTATTNSAAHL